MTLQRISKESRVLQGGELAQHIPKWLKTGLPDAGALGRVIPIVSSLDLNTICLEARCPNKQECFGEGSVTFLILGRHCTRFCRFCNVTGAAPQPVDPGEPERVVEACRRLELDHVVITSVTRDDLADGGAGHFARTIKLIHADRRGVSVEVLVPDFAGNQEAVETVARAGPDVFAHNLETVERLYPSARDRADYSRSLGILSRVRSAHRDMIVKSGLILGIGETLDEVKSTLEDIARAGCDIVTVGQYMRPSREHMPVAVYLDPAVFEDLESYASELGLVAVCGPRVRSSYKSKAAFREAKLRRRKCA
jgi:lipoic acid synthetase